MTQSFDSIYLDARRRVRVTHSAVHGWTANHRPTKSKTHGINREAALRACAMLAAVKLTRKPR